MDQLGATAPPYLAEIDGINAVCEFVPTSGAIARLHAGTSVCAEPSDILIPERRATPFLGRAAEMAALRAWLSGPAQVAVQHITGGAGVGKTRLAIELCAWADAQGWDCGFITADAAGSFAVHNGGAPLLLVFDDVGMPIGACSGDPWTDWPPLRVIMIGDDAPPNQELARIFGVVPVEVAEPLRLAGLHANNHRLALLRHAMSLAARAACVPACLPDDSTALEIDDPSRLLMAGLIAPQLGIRAALSEAPVTLARRLAMQERWRLERLAPILGLDAQVLGHVAACVTLQAGSTLEATVRLVHEEAAALAFHLPASCDEIADRIADALGSADRDLLAPVAPLSVGAAFMVEVIGRHSPETQAAIIERALRRSPGAVAHTIRRIARHDVNGDAAPIALQWQQYAGL